jgi:transcriptional regulator with XRE-family HTH domain
MNIPEHIDALRAKLQRCPMTREQVARATGGTLSASWVSKFASGRMRNPRMDSLLALERALDSHQTDEAA